MDASEAFVKVVRGEIVPQIKQDAYSALINLSGDPFTAEALVCAFRGGLFSGLQALAATTTELSVFAYAKTQTDNPDNLLIPELVTEILDSKSEFADKACIVLANLTRNTEHAVVRVLKVMPCIHQRLRCSCLIGHVVWRHIPVGQCLDRVHHAHRCGHKL